MDSKGLTVLGAAIAAVVVALPALYFVFKPAPVPGDVRGRWSPTTAANCDERTYIFVKDDVIQQQLKGGPVATYPFNVSVEKAVGHAELHLHITGQPNAVYFVLRADVTQDQMSFDSIEWSPEMTGAEYDNVKSSFPIDKFFAELQKTEPLRRCI